MSTFVHTDVDGDRLAIFPAHVPGEGSGVNFRTDPRGSTVLVEDIPYLVERICMAADKAEASWEDE